MGMKAIESQLSNQSPGIQTVPSKEVQTNGPNRSDSIYARLRRLELRIAHLELKASTVRRDVDRIEKRQYAEVKSPSKKYLPVDPNDLHGLGTMRPGGTQLANFGMEEENG